MTGRITWEEYAQRLRDVLDRLDVAFGRCLPHEPDACGYDYAHHCMGYLAALQAWAEDGLERIHHGDVRIEQQATTVLEHWRGVFAGEHAWQHPEGQS